MPMQSKAQNAAMHAAAAGDSTIGIPQSVGKKFVAHGHGQNVKALPKHASPFKLKREKRREEKEPKAMHRREGAAGERSEGER